MLRVYLYIEEKINLTHKKIRYYQKWHFLGGRTLPPLNQKIDAV
jgi:hypothetical protein